MVKQSARPASGSADDRLAQLGPETANRGFSEAFRSGLAALGYTEGNNIRVLYRHADGHAERLSALASELVSLGALVIVTNGSSSIQDPSRAQRGTKCSNRLMGGARTSNDGLGAEPGKTRRDDYRPFFHWCIRRTVGAP